MKKISLQNILIVAVLLLCTSIPVISSYSYSATKPNYQGYMNAYQRSIYMDVKSGNYYGLIKLGLTSKYMYSKNVTWESSDTRVAIVNQNGYVRGLMLGGSAYIRARDKSTNKIIGECLVINKCKDVADYIALVACGYLGKTGTEMFNIMGIGSTDWCALFACYCYDRANALSYNNNLVKPFMLKEANGTKAGSYAWDVKHILNLKNFKYKNSSYLPQKGDMIVFEWGDGGNPDHVGIVIDNNYIVNNKRYIRTVEGNIGNQNFYSSIVGCKMYLPTDTRIVGYLSLKTGPFGLNN